jgi:hypothetical protein
MSAEDEKTLTDLASKIRDSRGDEEAVNAHLIEVNRLAADILAKAQRSAAG